MFLSCKETSLNRLFLFLNKKHFYIHTGLPKEGASALNSTPHTTLLKEHGQLVHMRIRCHFIANLHITLHHKTRERRTETEKRINLNKPCRIEVFANQSSGYIHVTS